MPTDVPFSWTKIHSDTKALCEDLKETGKEWKAVVAVTRGGMVPACIVARDLDIRELDTISVSSYDYQSQSEARIGKAPEGIEDGEGYLIVDDLSDTGKTFNALRQMFPKATFACVYVKPKGKATADYYVTEVSQDSWIYFPWEDQEFPPHIMDEIGSHLKA